MKENKRITDLELISQYEKTIEAPFVDSLTGLFNHGFFQISVDKELKRCQRQGSFFTLVLMDLDSFSLLNRRQTHLHGDLILKKLAGLVRENLREADLAPRYSGDVIAVMMVNSDIEPATVPIERIRQAVEETHTGKATIRVY